jgi:hypothetical protein
MSFVIAATVMAAGTVVSAYGQYQMGKFQEESMKRQAELKKLEGMTNELSRREQLNASIAANQLAMSMSNISGETPKSIALQSARDVSTDEGQIGLTDRLTQRLLIREGKASAFAGKVGAGGTLLSGLGSAYATSKTPIG